MADLSPELASRIQSLEQSYGDNPGRYFVALAGAWREGGDIARAEEILRENLKRFPGLSAHVLLGRCLADRGAFQEAANEFHYVLSIDSQNLIALRTLAEMASAGGRRAEAERWYNELLAVDPMNVEARAALQQLARTPSAPAAPAEPAGPGWGDVEPAAMDAGVGSDGGEFGMIDLSEPDASPADASGVAADDNAGLEWGDLTLDAPDEAPAPQAAPAGRGGSDGDFDGFGFVDLDADASSSPASQDASSQWMMDGDARQDVGESAAEDAGSLPLLDDDMIDAPLAGADLPLLDLGTSDDDSLVSPEPGAGFGFGEPASGPLDDVGYVAHEQDGHDADAEMVTETMAELYASQGLLAQAADVYRELIGQRGEEPGLVRRLAEIEARMNPESAAGSASAGAFPAFAAETESEETPDWLQSVDAFARGGTEPTLDAGVPGLDLSPAQTDETFAAESEETAASAGELPSFAATDDFPSFEPAASDDLPFLAAADDLPSFAAAGDLPSFAPPASDDLPSFAAADDLPSFAPPADDALPAFEPAADFALPSFEPAADFAQAGSAPEPAGASASADPFADSFAGGFDGAVDVPAAASASAPADAAGDDRQPWQSPSVAETEPVGFDILVIEDEDGAETPAPADVVADMSADWAMAAAPLDDDLDEDEAEADFAPSAPEPIHAEPAEAEPVHAAPAFTAPAFAAPAGAGERTMRGYFASLLAWQPVPAGAPTYELSAEGGAITIEAAQTPAAPAPADAPYEAPSPGVTPVEAPAPDDEPLPYEAPEPEPLPYESPEPEPLPYEAPEAASFDAPAFPAAPSIPTFDAPSFQPPAPAFGEPAPAAQADDEPWAAAAPAPVTEDEPWAAAMPVEATVPDAAAMPGESAPDTAAVPTPDDLPLLDLEEPWAESPAAPREPVDIGAFELADDDAPAAPAPSAASAGDDAEELLPWEMPAEPAAAAAAPEPVAEPAAGAFSFEDFFAGSPAEPAAPPAVPAPATPAAPEPVPFFPSFAEPTPPPTFEEMSPEPAFAAPAPAPTPAPAPAAPTPAAPAAAGGDEEDEDLESFQAWLQSLKR